MAFRPIRREFAVRYSENVVISFVITLLGIRLFLEATGYPQISSGTLHVAHVLWGGLFLLAGALVALMYRNQALLTLSSILTGVGWGFFIDELGKFITADNDYFFRPAAPIIYLTFLALWFLVLQLQKARTRTPDHAQIYHILDRFEEVIEASIDRAELNAMKKQLLHLSQDRQDGITDELALALLHFVEREDIKTKEARPSLMTRWMSRVRRLIDRLVLSQRMQSTGFPLLIALYGCLLLVASLANLAPLLWPSLSATLHSGLDVDPFSSSTNLALFLLMNALRIAVALTALRAARDVFRQQQGGWQTARTALLLAIAAVDLLVFYFNQFSAATTTVVDAVLLGWVNEYQRHSRLEMLEYAL